MASASHQPNESEDAGKCEKAASGRSEIAGSVAFATANESVDEAVASRRGNNKRSDAQECRDR